MSELSSLIPINLELLSNTTDGVFAVDSSQKIILWNKAAEGLLGFTADEVVGKQCHEVIAGCNHNERLICFQDCWVWQTVKRGELVPSHNLLSRHKSGVQVWINASVVSMLEGWEKPVLVYIFREISSQMLLRDFVRSFTRQASNLPLGEEENLNSSNQQNPSPKQKTSLLSLTSRETEVLRLVADGLGTKGIAAELCISPFTVRNHIQKILSKLGVHSRLEAAALALKSGFFSSHLPISRLTRN